MNSNSAAALRRVLISKTSYTIEELVIWQTKLPNVQFALLPPSDTRPNPIADAEKVYVSIFSPGAVCALERHSGRVLWRREIKGLAGAAIHLAAQRVFAKSPNTLLCMNPRTGETLWSFSPHGLERETMYSAPTIYGDKLFIGDRRGFLHCLDVRTGQPLWQVLTNRAGKDVNATPLAVNNRIFVATNASRAAAYSLDGEKVWETALDAPSILEVLWFKGAIGVAAESLYLLDPKTGEIKQRYSWPGDRVQFVCNSPHRMVIILPGCWPPRGGEHLIIVNRSGIVRRYRVAYCLACRYLKETGFLYESHLKGLNISDPASGDIVFEIRAEGAEGIGLVDVKDGVIYAMTDKGVVLALRHPSA